MAEVEPDSAETVRLLQEVRRGDARAFDQLFTRYRPTLREFVAARLSARVRARVDPSDVVQETQFEAFRRLPDFLERQPMPFHLWLRKTAHERLLKVRRFHDQGKRAVDREVGWPDASSLLLAQQLLAAGSAASPTSLEEMTRRVDEGLAGLSDPDRAVLRMRLHEGLSHDEIACVLEINAATARKRYARALLRLRTALFGDQPPETQP